jgi:nucleoside 2-deoxyribosyltransferase
MKLFITAKFKGDENKPDIEKVCGITRDAGFDDFCFIRDVEKYQIGVFPNPHDLMDRAREELLKCDALLIDVTDSPSGGRIIEAGMAFGCGKKVIVITKKGSEIKVPVLGIANHVIEYDDIEDILEPLQQIAQA